MPNDQTTEVSPEISISTLYSRDPHLLTDDDIDMIIARVRELRVEWTAAETQAKITGTRVKKKDTAPKEKVNLDDLFS
jgi:hypothetical protein